MVFSSIAQSYFDEFPFRRKDPRKPSTGFFFLSHAHSDHIAGLKSSLSDPDATIVCSKETAAVIKVLLGIPKEKCLKISGCVITRYKFQVNSVDILSIIFKIISISFVTATYYVKSTTNK